MILCIAITIYVAVWSNFAKLCHTKVSTHISSAETAILSSKALSTSGWRTPTFPISRPSTYTSPQRPGKNAGPYYIEGVVFLSVCGRVWVLVCMDMCMCVKDVLLKASTIWSRQSNIHSLSADLITYPAPFRLNGIWRSCMILCRRLWITCTYA